jgi:hypothetical protein
MAFRYHLTDAQGLCAVSSLYQCELSKTKQSIDLGNPSHYQNKNKKDQDEFLDLFIGFLKNGNREIINKQSNDSESPFQIVGNKIAFIVKFLQKYRDSSAREWPPRLSADKWMNMGYNNSYIHCSNFMKINQFLFLLIKGCMHFFTSGIKGLEVT